MKICFKLEFELLLPVSALETTPKILQIKLGMPGLKTIQPELPYYIQRRFSDISDYQSIFIPKKSFVITIIITFLIVRMKVCLSCISVHSALDFLYQFFMLK